MDRPQPEDSTLPAAPTVRLTEVWVAARAVGISEKHIEELDGRLGRVTALRAFEADRLHAQMDRLQAEVKEAFASGRKSAIADHDRILRENKGFDPECRCQQDERFLDAYLDEARDPSLADLNGHLDAQAAR